MTQASQNKIAAVRKRLKVTQQQLADKVGSHWVTISKLERGEIKLTMDWIEKLAAALEVDVLDLYEFQALKREVRLRGTVFDGGIVDEYTDAEMPSQPIVTDDADDLVSDWYKIEGDYLEPYFYDGDVLKATYYDPDVMHLLIGRLANIKLTDGRVILGVVDKHLKNKQFNIATLRGTHLKNVSVEQIGVITEHLIKVINQQRQIAKLAKKKS